MRRVVVPIGQLELTRASNGTIVLHASRVCADRTNRRVAVCLDYFDVIVYDQFCSGFNFKPDIAQAEFAQTRNRIEVIDL